MSASSPFEMSRRERRGSPRPSGALSSKLAGTAECARSCVKSVASTASTKCGPSDAMAQLRRRCWRRRLSRCCSAPGRRSSWMTKTGTSMLQRGVFSHLYLVWSYAQQFGPTPPSVATGAGNLARRAASGSSPSCWPTHRTRRSKMLSRWALPHVSDRPAACPNISGSTAYTRGSRIQSAPARVRL